MVSYLVVGGVAVVLGFVAGLLVGKKNPSIASATAALAAQGLAVVKKA